MKYKENSPIGENRGVVALIPDRKVVLSYRLKKTVGGTSFQDFHNIFPYQKNKEPHLGFLLMPCSFSLTSCFFVKIAIDYRNNE